MAYFDHEVGHAPGSHQFLGALIPAVAGLVGAFAGGRGQKQQTQRQFQDTRLYEFAPEERAGVRSGMLGTLGDLLGNSPGGAAFWGAGGPGGGGGFGGGGGAGAGHAGASLVNLNDPRLVAHASQIDLNNPLFSLTAPEQWMSGMLSRGREYTSAATEDSLRLMRDEALRSGMSTSSPAFMWMQNQQRKEQSQALANALRDANLAWTLPAAEGGRQALGQNAAMQTDVSKSNANLYGQMSATNAQLGTQASIANAANRTSASIANAQMRQQAGQWGAEFARQGYRDLWSMMKDVITPTTSMAASGETQTGGGGWAGALAGGMAGVTSGMNFMNTMSPGIYNNLFGGGGQAAAPAAPGGWYPTHPFRG